MSSEDRDFWEECAQQVETVYFNLAEESDADEKQIIGEFLSGIAVLPTAAAGFCTSEALFPDKSLATSVFSACGEAGGEHEEF